MADLFEVTGIDVVVQRLTQIAATMPMLGGIALQQEAEAILEASQPLVPIETGALKSSGVVDDVVIQGQTVQTAVRYGGKGGENFTRNPEEYAYWVHEITTYHHPIGRDHFLSEPLFAATSGMLARIAQQLSNAL